MTAPTEAWAAVADDAVKVGLGAVIGAAGAVFVAFLNHRHSSRSESDRRTAEFLKEISSRFAVASGDYRIRIGFEAQLPFIPETEKLKLEILRKQRDTHPAADKLRSEFDQIGALANIEDFQKVVDALLEFLQAQERLTGAIMAANQEKKTNGVGSAEHHRAVRLRMSVLDESNAKVHVALREALNESRSASKR